MILEHAILQVDPGRQHEFEAAFAEAQALISASAGFQSLELLRCVEEEGKYLLLVGWDSIDDHEQGFRDSPAYEEWKGLLHHFYEPFPVVQHYASVFSL